MTSPHLSKPTVQNSAERGCSGGLKTDPAARRAVAAMVTKSGRVRRPRAMSEDISSDDLASLDSGQVFALDQFAVDELVLVRNVNRQDDFWPVGWPRLLCGGAIPHGTSHLPDVWESVKGLWGTAGYRGGPDQKRTRGCAATDAARQALCYVFWPGVQQGNHPSAANQTSGKYRRDPTRPGSSAFQSRERAREDLKGLSESATAPAPASPAFPLCTAAGAAQ